MKKTLLRKYARLIAVMGARPKKGQWVIVTSEPNQPEFVAMVVEECYRAGAGKVTVEWDYQPLTKLHTRYQSVKSLSAIADWQKEKLEYQCKTLPARVYLESSDPDGLKGINTEKHAKVQKNRYPIIKPYRDRMENKYQWVIAAVPGESWAKKVFPGMRTAAAIEKLWQAILFTCRIDEDSDPVENWKAHNADIRSRCDYLNSLGLRELRYRAANGTNLRVGLIEDALFQGGDEALPDGSAVFNPNIPTEEIFTSPRRGDADGIVYSSKPLSYRGQLIEDFSVRFEGGKAVEVHARVGEELLKTMISMDDGAAYLGECALVPTTSPINQSGILFYNTLFDENAACHLALGAGFTNVLKNYADYTLKQCYEKGINDSMIHEDFMIGTEDLMIVGIDKDGKEYPIFQNGNWAF